MPSWFDRNKEGFAATALSATTLGIVCAVLVPVQLLLLYFAMRGFTQGWNVEEERPIRRDGRDFADPRVRTGLTGRGAAGRNAEAVRRAHPVYLPRMRRWWNR